MDRYLLPRRAHSLRGALLPFVLVLLVAMSARGAPPAAESSPLRLTLRNAVEIVLKQNPRVQIANLTTTVLQENQSEARSGLLL